MTNARIIIYCRKGKRKHLYFFKTLYSGSRLRDKQTQVPRILKATYGSQIASSSPSRNVGHYQHPQSLLYFHYGYTSNTFEKKYRCNQYRVDVMEVTTRASYVIMTMKQKLKLSIHPTTSPTTFYLSNSVNVALRNRNSARRLFNVLNRPFSRILFTVDLVNFLNLRFDAVLSLIVRFYGSPL